MRIDRHDRDVLIKLLSRSEDRLIDLILNYANQQGYSRYSSTLKEAWRLSIEGLSRAIIKVVEGSDRIPEMVPDEDYSSDPATKFGVIEAQRHRARGVNLSMFLGLMKYYRQSYLDLLNQANVFNHPASIALLVRRFFDRTELAYCDEWAGTKAEAQIKVLSQSNLRLASEKNKYLTLFESLSSPVILCDEEGKVDNYNNAAGHLLLNSDTPGSRYYAEQRNDLEPPGLAQELRHIQHTIEDLNSARQQLVQSEKMAAIGQLAAGVAHEINTPIQYVNENLHFIKEAFEDLVACTKTYQQLLLFLETEKATPELLRSARNQLKDAELDYLFDEIPEALSQSEEGVKKVAEIVSAMKNFAQPGTTEKVHTDLNESILSTLSVSANEWKNYAEIETDLQSDLPYVPVVPGEINQALLNIVVNAASAIREKRERNSSREKGKITIHTHKENDWVVIQISDTGIGIPQAIHCKIFDPFFTTRELGQGTGQGLTVVYLAVVKMHAGMISVQSIPGGGTTFKIMLPITPNVNDGAERELWRHSQKSIV
ncbi:MAG: ATP-binding protein [Candidatus Thiodiazotropha sp.]